MTGADNRDLGRRARQSVMWNSGLLILINLGQFGVMLVLVRLLSPETYGQYGLLMGLIGFIYVFSAQGFVDYSLQIRDVRHLHWQELFTTSVIVNGALCIATNAVAVLLSYSEDYSSVAPPLHWLSLTLLLHPGRAMRITMLKRDLNWRRIGTLHLIGFVLSTALSIPMAIAGAGIYALLISTFIVPLPFLYDLFVCVKWRPNWAWSLARVAPAIEFGLNRLFSGLIVAGRRLVESAFVVQMLGFASFGIFGRAISLAEILCNRLVGYALEALYPALTKIEVNTDRFRRVGGLVLRTVAWFSIPVAILFAVVSEFLVVTLYGKKWLDVIPLMELAFAMAATGTIRHTLYRLLLAHEQKRHCLILDLMLFTATVCSLVFFLESGLTMYMSGMVAAQLLLIIMASIWLIQHDGLNLTAFGKAFIVPLLAGGTALFATDGVTSAIELPTDSLTLVTAQVMMFSAVYVVVIRVFFCRLLAEIVSELPFHGGMKRILLMT